MNDLGKSIVRKLNYALGANAVGLIVSVLSILILPKFMSVSDYGLYQIFLYYFGYIGLLHFGILGGAIIQNSGYRYSELNYSSLKTQCFLLFFSLLFFSVLIYIINLRTNIFQNSYVIYFFIPSMIFQHIIWYSISILQMSNRIEDASRLLFFERVSWGGLAIGLVLLGYSDILIVLFIFTTTRFLVGIGSLLLVPEVVTAPLQFDSFLYRTFIANFRLGFPITLSDICALLIIGIIRFSISEIWGVEFFAKTSLILSITYFFLSFIVSASTVLLPVLRQLKKSESDYLYIPLHNIISYAFTSILIIYYPLQIIVNFWLPRYSDSIIYMGILFPVVYFESKFNLLISTYFKTLLKTKIIFYLNALSTVISFAGSVYFAYYMHDLEYTVGLITIILGLRCILGELILGYWMGVNKTLFFEYICTFAMLILFIISIKISDIEFGFLFYLLCAFIYLLLRFKTLKYSVTQIKMFVFD